MDFFGVFRSKNKGSKNTAKDRLQLVLVHARAGVYGRYFKVHRN